MPDMNIHVKHTYAPHDFAAMRALSHTLRMDIAKLRKLRGLNQTELGELAGITQPTVSRIEKGDDGTTLGLYRAYAAALNVSLADIFADGRTIAEAQLLDAFRQLSPDRQKGWLEMAKLAAGQMPAAAPEKKQTARHPTKKERA